MYLMVGILILAAIILGTVVLYNLGALSFIEKTREIATLKVLGFRTRRIRGILQKQNLWITAAGILLGIPLGYGLLAALCGSISESQDMIPYVSKASMLLSAAGTLLVSAGVNFLLSGKDVYKRQVFHEMVGHVDFFLDVRGYQGQAGDDVG